MAQMTTIGYITPFIEAQVVPWLYAYCFLKFIRPGAEYCRQVNIERIVVAAYHAVENFHCFTVCFHQRLKSLRIAVRVDVVERYYLDLQFRGKIQHPVDLADI